jgi:hypothetical protein
VPDDRWFVVQGSDDLGGVIGDLLKVFPARTLGFARACSTVSGSSGRSGVSGA